MVQWLSPHAARKRLRSYGKRLRRYVQYCGGTNCSGKWSARMSTYRFTSPGAMGEGEVEPDATVIRVVHASDLLCRCQGKGLEYYRGSRGSVGWVLEPRPPRVPPPWALPSRTSRGLEERPKWRKREEGSVSAAGAAEESSVSAAGGPTGTHVITALVGATAVT